MGHKRVSYTDNFYMKEQEHQEQQLDALTEVYRKRLEELHELMAAKPEAESKLRLLHNAKEELQRNIEAEQLHQSQMAHSIQNALIRVSYDVEYKQRQQYYQSFSLSVDSETSLISTLTNKGRNYKGIIVSPDGLIFKNNRQKTLLKSLAEMGFLCFCFNHALDSSIEHREGSLYEYKDELVLLEWLKSERIKPVVLCTWVLQSAWFDLLEYKTIWYDICDHEDVLWGTNALSRLKHYDLVITADLVTFSDRRWKKYTAARNDSVLLDPAEKKENFSTYMELFGGHNRVPQRRNL
ncbi:hypothetical protein ACFOLF_24240 [Paenibacillus sepulcri]|uniref:Uncharacterized protein n=1 Tax=Paenibacillus sepulcri TaxID=359917 RepID=A0ABS7BVV0_9BACL|nr:hypothetical protein [Paenibacillus sepulcri]